MTAPAGLVHQVLGVIATADMWHGDPVVDTFERLLETLDEDDLASLPMVLGESLAPLRGDADHFDLALALIGAFHLYEAEPGLLLVLATSPTRRAWITAAAVASHPALAPRLHTHLLERSRAEEMPPEVDIVLRGRVPPAGDDLSRAMLAEHWPGRIRIQDAVAPLTTVVDGAGQPADQLRLLLELRRRGSQVRRLPAAAPAPPEGWLPNWGVLVTDREQPPWYHHSWPVIRTHGRLTPAARHDVQRRRERFDAGHLHLKRVSMPLPQAGLGDPLVDFELFFEGALEYAETRYLTGWPTRTLRRHARHKELHPQYAGRLGTPYFTFAQLTALRVEAYLRFEHGRNIGRSLAAKIVRQSLQERAVPTHVTLDGDVLFEEGDALTEESGQQRMKEVVFTLGEIVRTFSLGGGRTVPELLRPSTHTRVHPVVQRGAPHVAGTRITARGVREVMKAARGTALGGRRLLGFVRGIYPELTDAQIEDAARVGEDIAV